MTNLKSFGEILLVLTVAFLLSGFALAQVSDKTCEDEVYYYYRGEKTVKPHYDCVPRNACGIGGILVIFRTGAQIRLRDGELVSISAPTNTVEREELNKVKSIFAQYGVLDKIERRLGRSEVEIEKDNIEAEEMRLKGHLKGFPAALDFHLWYEIGPLDHLTDKEKVELVNALNKLYIVEYANFPPKPIHGIPQPASQNKAK